MKLKYLASFLSLFFLLSCSIDNDDNNLDLQEQQEIEIFQWHLTNVSGGIEGIDIDFENDTVIWVFSVDFAGSGSLQVENNNADNSIEDGLDSGVYSISIPVYNGQSILFIEGNEYSGLHTPSDEDLILNTNITSNGKIGSDGFIYTFKRKIIKETTG